MPGSNTRAKVHRSEQEMNGIELELGCNRSGLRLELEFKRVGLRIGLIGLGSFIGSMGLIENH